MQNDSTEQAWTDSRAAELDALHTLLREVSMLNKSTSFIERATKCIAIADDLLRSDLSDCRPSFSHFLMSEAIKSRQSVADNQQTRGDDDGS
jgi:hypothetical protein